jgi:hypothetical protein
MQPERRSGTVPPRPLPSPKHRSHALNRTTKLTCDHVGVPLSPRRYSAALVVRVEALLGKRISCPPVFYAYEANSARPYLSKLRSLKIAATLIAISVAMSPLFGRAFDRPSAPMISACLSGETGPFPERCPFAATSARLLSTCLPRLRLWTPSS